ncbi:hypothetical protein F6S89_20220 [Escherichia coli]|nr:hypothetical protein [Escherichia coli]
MNADTWTRLQAFRHALELTSCEASLTAGYDHLKDFPAGCSELASQTLTDYLTEDGSNLYSCIVGMQWDNGPGRYGHVIAAPARDYIDLTLDQFPGYHNRIAAEPVESGGQLAADLNKEPAISTADGIVASASDKVNYITEQKNRQPMVIITECYKLIRMTARFIPMCQSSQLFQHQIFPRLFIISDVGSCSLSRNTLDRLATDWKVTLSVLSL